MHKYLKQLDANTGKNKLEQKRDKKDIVDGLYCDDDALYDMLSTKHIHYVAAWGKDTDQLFVSTNYQFMVNSSWYQVITVLTFTARTLTTRIHVPLCDWLRKKK